MTKGMPGRGTPGRGLGELVTHRPHLMKAADRLPCCRSAFRAFLLTPCGVPPPVVCRAAPVITCCAGAALVQEDLFFTEFPGLGDITEIEIGHDNSGPSPGWHCEQVVVIDETANKTFTFPCDRWEPWDGQREFQGKGGEACVARSAA